MDVAGERGSHAAGHPVARRRGRDRAHPVREEGERHQGAAHAAQQHAADVVAGGQRAHAADQHADQGTEAEWNPRAGGARAHRVTRPPLWYATAGTTRSRGAGPSSGLANQPSEYAAVSALSTEAGEQPFTISLPLELTFHFAGEG